MKLISAYTPSHEIFIKDWFLPGTPQGLQVDPNFSSVKKGGGAFLEESWTSGVKAKSDTIIQAIKSNWNDVILYSDVDVQFFSGDEKYFQECIKDKDIVLQRDDPEGNFCTGFFVARCNERVLKLWENVRQAIDVENRDQLAFNRFVRQMDGLRYGYLPSEDIFGGGTFLGQVWKRGLRLHVPRRPLVHHANWVVGVDEKIAQMELVKKTLFADRPKLKRDWQEPVLTVITPVLNNERYIEECLLNVIDQHCLKVEHVLVDGGSTDRTVEIIKSYAAEYPHIRFLSEPDSGQSDAMNKGIKMARGRIISFLNADDFYEAGVLSRVLDLIGPIQEPAFIAGNCKIWGNYGLLRGTNRPKRLGLDELLMGYDINQFPVNPSAYFYSKSLHEKIGLFNVDDHYNMDLDFILRAVKVCQLRYFDESWGNFRYMEGTKTYVESQSERHTRRVHALLESYLRELSLSRRMRIHTVQAVSSLRSKVEYYGRRSKHYLRTPREIGSMVRRKFARK